MHLIIVTVHLPFYHFISKITQMVMLSTLESSYHIKNIKFTSRWFIQAQRMQNLRVRQSQVCYLHTTHLGPLNQSTSIKKIITQTPQIAYEHITPCNSYYASITLLLLQKLSSQESIDADVIGHLPPNPIVTSTNIR